MYLVPFLKYIASKNGATLKPGIGVVFKVIENGAVRQIIYDFYWSAIVSIALCCTIFDLFDVK